MTTKVSIQGKVYQISEQIKGMMEYFSEAQALQKTQNETICLDSIDNHTLSRKTFQRILFILNLIQNKLPLISKIKSSNPCQAIGQPLSVYFTQLTYPQLNELYLSCQFLKLIELKKCITAYLGSKVFIQPTLQSYNQKMGELGVKHRLTAQRAKKMRELYTFMN